MVRSISLSSTLISQNLFDYVNYASGADKWSNDYLVFFFWNAIKFLVNVKELKGVDQKKTQKRRRSTNLEDIFLISVLIFGRCSIITRIKSSTDTLRTNAFMPSNWQIPLCHPKSAENLANGTPYYHYPPRLHHHWSIWKFSVSCYIIVMVAS